MSKKPQFWAKKCHSKKILTIIKHIPGHGRAKVDSHYYLPIIKSSKKVLQEDFYPFKKLNKQPFAMIAHIKYLDLDKEKCATYSEPIISFIKNKYLDCRHLMIILQPCTRLI